MQTHMQTHASIATSATEPPSRLQGLSVVVVILAILLSPLWFGRFVEFNLQYGWVFFAAYAASLALLVLPIMVAEAWLSHDQRLSLWAMQRQLAPYRRYHWLYLPVLLSLLTLVLLAAIYVVQTVLALDEWIAVTLPDFWRFGELESNLKVHRYWQAQQADNWPLLLLWLVALGVALVWVFRRRQIERSYRWLKLLLLSWLLVLLWLCAEQLGLELSIGQGAAQSVAGGAAETMNSGLWPFVIQAGEQWLLSQWPTLTLLHHAVMHALLTGLAGVGLWSTLRGHSTRSPKSLDSAVAASQVWQRRSFGWLTMLLVYLAVLILVVLVMFFALAAHEWAQVESAVQVPYAQWPYMLVGHWSGSQVMAWAWLLLVVLAGLGALLALIAALMAAIPYGRNPVFARVLGLLTVLVLMVISAALLHWREVFASMSYWVFAVGLPLAGWTVVTLLVKVATVGLSEQQEQPSISQRMNRPEPSAPSLWHRAGLWYCRYPLRLVLLLIVLANLGVLHWLLVVFRL